jgi:beta-lactam-binding protein with PASTA domain
MGWIAGAWATGAWRGTAWAVQDAPVAVPDVVGETQAAGTATLEGDGFVVAVETAYSSLVAAGLIISQAPAGGASAASGSVVTITVSLGEAPAPVQQDATGGFWPEYDRHAAERRRRKREQEEREAEAERIQDELDRQIAQLMREQEAKDAERVELTRLQKLADTYSGKKLGLPKKVSDALINAYEMRSRNALEQLQREIERANEDELLAVQTAVLLLLN